MDTLTLRTGVEAVPAVVVAITRDLKSLWKEGQSGRLLVYDLAMRCKNFSHPISKGDEDRLKRLSLIEEDGSVHESTKEIVLASVEGEGADMRLVSPLQ